MTNSVDKVVENIKTSNLSSGRIIKFRLEILNMILWALLLNWSFNFLFEIFSIYNMLEGIKKMLFYLDSFDWNYESFIALYK